MKKLLSDIIISRHKKSHYDKPLVWWRYIDDIVMIWQHWEKKLRGHPFMTSTKNDLFFDPPYPHHPQKWIIYLLFKNNKIHKHVTDFKTPPSPFCVDIINVWSLKEFLKILKSCCPTIKFTAEYSLDKVNFLDVEVIRSGNKLLTDVYIKLTDTHQYLEFSSFTHIILKNLFHIARLSVLVGFVQKMFFDNRCNQLEWWLKEVTMKMLLDNKFWKQGNLPGKIYLTEIPKLRGETNLSLILLTIQPIQNLNIFYQILTCC